MMLGRFQYMSQIFQTVYSLNQHDAKNVLVYVPDCIRYKPYIFTNALFENNKNNTV